MADAYNSYEYALRQYQQWKNPKEHSGVRDLARQLHEITVKQELGGKFALPGASSSSSLLSPLAIPTPEEMSTARGLTSLKSEFSWSASRARLFEKSKEDYYMRYYAGWGGWERKAPKSVRAAYQRGKMRNAAMWVGTEVHEQIADTIIAIAGDPSQPVNPALRRIHLEKAGGVPAMRRSMSLDMAVRMRRRYQESASGMHVQSPAKFLRLREHEAGTAANRLLAQSQKAAQSHYNAFTDSRWMKMLVDPTSKLREADKLRQFIVGGQVQMGELTGGTNVFAGPDMLLQTQRRKGGMTSHIVDWKTGAGQGPGGSLSFGEIKQYKRQLDVYALYAQQELQIDPKDMRLVIAHMNNGKMQEHVFQTNAARIQRTEKRILKSADAMRAGLVSPDVNIAREGAFLSAERMAEHISPRVGMTASAEKAGMRRAAEQKVVQQSRVGRTIENAWAATPLKWRLGGALAGLATLGWWMSSDSQKRSKRGDPRSRGYGWSPADARINPGVSTARMMYESGGFGGMA